MVESMLTCPWCGHRAAKTSRLRFSVRSRKSQQVFAHEAQDQIVRNGGGAIEPGFTPFALDVVFLGKAVSAQGVHCGFARLPRGLGSEVLCYVGFGTARQAGIKERGSLE